MAPAKSEVTSKAKEATLEKGRPRGGTPTTKRSVGVEPELRRRPGSPNDANRPNDALLRSDLPSLQQLVGNRAVATLPSVQRADPPKPPRPLKRQGAGLDPDEGLITRAQWNTIANTGQRGITRGGALAGAGLGGALGASPSLYGDVSQNLGGTMSGHGTFNTGSTANVSDFGGGLGVATGGLGLIAGGGLMYYGHRERQQALSGEKKNWARHRIGGRTMRGGAWMMAGGAVGATLGGVELGALAKGQGAAGSALAPAAFGLMAAAGAVTAAKGIWKFGKAASKHFKLGDLQPVTTEGQMWLAKARQQERNKMKVAGFKTLVGGLGIAAGATLLTGNPIGWALGLGAAALGGIGFIGGLYNKFSQKKQDLKDKEKIRKETEERRRQTAQQNQGSAPPQKHEEIKKQTAEVAQAGHSNLQVGEQMRTALMEGDGGRAEPVYKYVTSSDRVTEAPPYPNAYAGLRAGNRTFTGEAPNYKDFLALDSMMILNVLNVSGEEARSEHGPELIQAKLSAAEAN